MKSKPVFQSLLVPLALLLPAALASGQAAAPAQVAMKLDMVSWGNHIEGLRIKSRGNDLPFTAHSFEYSTPVDYAGPAIMEIYGSGGAGAAPAEAAPGEAPPAGNLLAELAKRRKEKPDLVALALLPAGSKHATVLLAAMPGGIYQTYVIDDDPAKLPPGRLRIHNQTPIPIAVRCNRTTTAELKLGQSTVVKPVDRSVIYELAYERNGKWKMQENNIVTVEDADQVQLIVLKSDADFFTSGDGSRGGFLQTVILRRTLAQQ